MGEGNLGPPRRIGLKIESINEISIRALYTSYMFVSTPYPYLPNKQQELIMSEVSPFVSKENDLNLKPLQPSA